MVKKVDGIIEAVRYRNGQIVSVRAYARRGATFSDRVLIERKELLELIRSGKRFVAGLRKEYMASTFEEGRPVKLVNQNGRDIISTRDTSEHDELEQVPIF